jgi:transposase
MSVQRKRYSAEEKTRVAIEAIKGQQTLNELAAEYGVHPSQITHGRSRPWKRSVWASLGDERGVSEPMKRWWRLCIKRVGS